MPVHHIVTTHRAWKSGGNRAYENVPLSYPRKVDFQAGQLSFLLPQWAKSLGSHLPTKYKSPTIKTFAEFESCLSEEQVGIHVFLKPRVVLVLFTFTHLYTWVVGGTERVYKPGSIQGPTH